MKKLVMFMAFFALVAIMLGGIPTICDSQEVFPTRPVQIIVNFPPGGVADSVARPLAISLERIFKQSVPVINKVGAGGAVGAQSAAVAKPDGYTLLVALATITVIPEVDTLFGRPRLYELDDFVPIALLTRDPLIFVVRKDTPWKTLQEFVDDAKKRPNEIKFASGGMYTPPHLGAELFADKIGWKFRHIPMAGGAPALNAILGGHVECTLASLWGYPHIKSGDLRPLGCMGEKRNPIFPNIPTFKEQGLDVEFYMWSGFFARKGTPPAIIDFLREATQKAVNSTEFKTAMTKLDNPPSYLDAPEFKKFIESDMLKSIAVVRKIGKVQ